MTPQTTTQAPTARRRAPGTGPAPRPAAGTASRPAPETTHHPARGTGPALRPAPACHPAADEAPYGAGATVLCVRFRPLDGAPLPADTHAGLLDLLSGLTPVVQALPPDGALADVRGALRYFTCDTARLAAVIRVRALALHGVDSSIGAAPSPMLARMAAREARPGRTLLVPDEPAAVREFLARKPAVALDGVGTATARTLGAYGLDTVGRIAAAPLPALQRILGARAGRELHERAHGIDRTPVVPGATARSLAAERPFGRDEIDPERHRRALLSLTEELGARLRAEGQACRSLALTVRCADRTTLTRTKALPEPTAHSAALTAAAYAVYGSLGLQRARVRALSLRAEGLLPAERAARQLSFDPDDEKSRRIEAVVDRVRAKFGPGAVVPGSLGRRNFTDA
ncbi:DNA polymerase thumb domain-containing protein [Streptomyces sp. NPDC086023]|uniref:DNA polymerase Y family protein n=1 Tax=Streptomyces sp. NPDC086023 TaxID=3365746 RepID=UPI0037CE73E3